MASALSRRLDERKRLEDEHNNRTDLIRYVDRPPRIEATSAVCHEGKILVPAEIKVQVALIPEAAVRLVTISGIGDQVWARGVVRDHLDAGLKVYLETNYPWIFWDFVGQPGFHFWHEEQPRAYGLRVATYLGRNMSDGKSVYAAMAEHTKTQGGNFKLPIHPSWAADADRVIDSIKPTKPLLIYRPLVRNHGRRSVTSRNPDYAAYSAVFASIRELFHCISVQGGPGEDIVHADRCDTVFHNGALALTTVAALMAQASLVYTCAGMGLVLGAGVGAKVMAVMGGYEDAKAYADTCVYAPALLIDPIKPCRCYSDAHDCQKTVDVPSAIHRAKEFIECHLH